MFQNFKILFDKFTTVLYDKLLKLLLGILRVFILLLFSGMHSKNITCLLAPHSVDLPTFFSSCFILLGES